MTLVVFDSFLTIWYGKIYQGYFVCLLPCIGISRGPGQSNSFH